MIKLKRHRIDAPHACANSVSAMCMQQVATRHSIRICDMPNNYLHRPNENNDNNNGSNIFNFFFRIFLSDCCVFVSFGFCSPHQAIACCRFWMHIAHCHRLDSNKCGNCEWHVFHLPTALHQHCTALVPSYRQSSACISHAASCPCECVCFPCLYNRIRVHDVFQLMDKLSIFVLLLPLPSLTLPPLSQLHLMLILLLFLIA